MYDVVEKRIVWDKQFDYTECTAWGFFKFGPDDQYILLHGTHIIDAKTGDLIYIWRKENNAWVPFRTKYFDFTKDGKYIVALAEIVDGTHYVRRNIYNEAVNGVPEGGLTAGGTIVPNPADGIAKLEVDIGGNTNAKITISTMQGTEVKMIFEGILFEGKHIFEIPTQELSAGTYFVNVQTSFGREIFKLVVTR